jgi:DNA-binding response OmpR family regulator
MLYGNEKIKILVIDDDEDDFFIIAGYINDLKANGFEIDWCNNYNAALCKLKGNTYQIYLVDYRLGTALAWICCGKLFNKAVKNPSFY